MCSFNDFVYYIQIGVIWYVTSHSHTKCLDCKSKWRMVMIFTFVSMIWWWLNSKIDWGFHECQRGRDADQLHQPPPSRPFPPISTPGTNSHQAKYFICFWFFPSSFLVEDLMSVHINFQKRHRIQLDSRWLTEIRLLPVVVNWLQIASGTQMKKMWSWHMNFCA